MSLSINDLKKDTIYAKLKSMISELESRLSCENGAGGSILQSAEFRNLILYLNDLLYQFDPFDSAHLFNQNLELL